MDAAPSFDLALARSAGAALAPRGPALSQGEIAEVVAGLRVAAAASEGHVARVTQLAIPAGGDMPVIDRRSWVRANVEMAAALLDEASGGPRVPATLRQRAEARTNALEVAGVLAVTSTRVLGQYLPFSDAPRLVLVAPNVARVERDLAVVPADFRLWVCLHEQTHRLQFAAAPWLRGYLVRQFAALLEAGDERTPLLQRRLPASVLDVVTTPAQRVVFDNVTAVMSLLEGYADVMMDRVGPEIVPTVATIRSRFEDRRDKGGWRRVVNKLMALDLKLAQYRDGAAFCRAVIEWVGVDGLNAVYEGPGLLPTLDEIHRPERWLARVHRVS